MRTSPLVRRLGAVAVAAVAGLVLAAGCSSSTPTVEGAAPNGSSNSDGTTGGTDGGTPGTGTDGGTGGGSGGGGGGEGAPTGTKPCTVLTNAEASQALGTTLNTTVDTDTECFYESGVNGVMFSITAEAFDESTAGDLSALGPMVEKLDGLGDAAYKVSLGEETQFHVWTKGKYVAILVTKEGGDTAGPGRTMLDKILSRI